MSLQDSFTPMSEEDTLRMTGRTVQQWDDLAKSEWERLTNEFLGKIIEASIVQGGSYEQKQVWAPMMMKLLLEIGASLQGNYILHGTDVANTLQRCQDVMDKAPIVTKLAFDQWKLSNPLHFVEPEGRG
jgi:hypothetical protein